MWPFLGPSPPGPARPHFPACPAWLAGSARLATLPLPPFFWPQCLYPVPASPSLIALPAHQCRKVHSPDFLPPYRPPSPNTHAPAHVFWIRTGARREGTMGRCSNNSDVGSHIVRGLSECARGPRQLERAFCTPKLHVGGSVPCEKNAHSPIRPSSSTPLTPEYQCCFLSVGGSVPACEKKRTFLSLDTRVGGNIDLRGRGGEVVLDIGSTIRVCVFFAPDGKDSGLPAKFSFKRWFVATLGRHGGGMCSWTCVGLWCVGNASFKAAGRDSGFALNTVFKHSSFAPRGERRGVHAQRCVRSWRLFLCSERSIEVVR